jgi:hypothetical protein
MTYFCILPGQRVDCGSVAHSIAHSCVDTRRSLGAAGRQCDALSGSDPTSSSFNPLGTHHGRIFRRLNGNAGSRVGEFQSAWRETLGTIHAAAHAVPSCFYVWTVFDVDLRSCTSSSIHIGSHLFSFFQAGLFYLIYFCATPRPRLCMSSTSK